MPDIEKLISVEGRLEATVLVLRSFHSLYGHAPYRPCLRKDTSMFAGSLNYFSTLPSRSSGIAILSIPPTFSPTPWDRRVPERKSYRSWCGHGASIPFRRHDLRAQH